MSARRPRVGADAVRTRVRRGVAAGALPRVAVVGAGAVGCYYGGMLARAGVPVTLIGRPAHVDAMRRDGLRLTHAPRSTNTCPCEASTDVAAVAGAALVLVCVKSTDTEATGAELAPHLAPDARVLSLQNGVDNAARLQAVLRRGRSRRRWSTSPPRWRGPGHVRHLGRGELVIPSDIGADGAAALGARAARSSRCSRAPACRWSCPTTSSARCGASCCSTAATTRSRRSPTCPYGRMVTLPGIAQTVHDAVVECLAVARGAGRHDPRRRVRRGRPHRHVDARPGVVHLPGPAPRQAHRDRPPERLHRARRRAAGRRHAAQPRVAGAGEGAGKRKTRRRRGWPPERGPCSRRIAMSRQACLAAGCGRPVRLATRPVAGAWRQPLPDACAGARRRTAQSVGCRGCRHAGARVGRLARRRHRLQQDRVGARRLQRGAGAAFAARTPRPRAASRPPAPTAGCRAPCPGTRCSRRRRTRRRASRPAPPARRAASAASRRARP